MPAPETQPDDAKAKAGAGEGSRTGIEVAGNHGTGLTRARQPSPNRDIALNQPPTGIGMRRSAATIAASLGMALILDANAGDLVVRVATYEHQGCHVGNSLYLPAGAEDGRAVRHVFPGGEPQCRTMIEHKQQECRMAVIFPSTNEGTPWQPGEKEPSCLAEFAAEVQRCIAHYELENAKCAGDDDNASPGAAVLESAVERSVFDGTWLVQGQSNQGVTFTYICTLTTRGSSIEERCTGEGARPGDVQTGVVSGQVARLAASSGSYATDLRAVDQDTLVFTYRYGSGTYKRQ